MDISIQDWPDKLHPLLGHISNALFVAIDFEISGISLKNSSSGAHGWQQHTLQQRYEAVKLAAEKYQILQVGITTVIEDERNRGYILRPYNIHLNPLIREPLGIDRSFSMQSSSVAFLQNHDFKIEKPFTIGVPYLSHYEEVLARAEEDKINGKIPNPDFFSKISDPAQITFLTKVRTKITDWLKMESKPNFLDIGPDCRDHAGQSSRGFTQPERQLIHQFVKAEFPYLTCHNLPDYVRVDFHHAYTDAAIGKHNARIFEAKLQRQIGLRYLFDGMISGVNLRNLDILSCFTPTTVPKTHADKQRVVSQFETVKMKLQRPTVLVGHNVFTDLVNLHACFIGPLPTRVEDFQKQIHKYFPLVIDTKYLAAQLGNTTGLRSSLREIDCELKDMPFPRVECHAYHSRYASEQYFSHEAGYDSYITAKTLIRLSAKLEALGYHTTQPKAQSDCADGDLIKLSEDPNTETEKLCSEELAAVFGIDLSLSSSSTQVNPIGTFSLSGHNNSTDLQILESIPSFETQFWRAYGNRLMVNGTVESVCCL